MQQYQNFYFIIIWSSTCFGRHTAHNQEPKTALAASGFAYVVGCWTCSCWTLTASNNYTSNNPPRMHCCILLDFLCELYYDARIHEHQVSRFNFLHQCMPSVAQPERLAILRNTKPDIHQRIRLLLFAIITNFLYQPIFRYCLEIICRTIEKSGLDFRPKQKTFLHRHQNASGANSCCHKLPRSFSHKV
jgi:hypothetical protein